MGTASTKFRKYLHNGDEYAAMQIFQSNPNLQRSLDPNTSYGEAYNHNTPLHFTARHAMKHLLRTFLLDLGGNPNKKNADNETSLHAVCQVYHTKSLSAQERRSACIVLILQWRGAKLENGMLEKADLSAVDDKHNTALHYAATSGLKKCVELLVAHGAPLFVENEDHLTPCDCAEKAGHEDVALYLESKMVFNDPLDTINEADLISLDLQEGYKGLRAQDLQEAKDQLLVETSDMLHVPLFTAEALLRNNEWSRKTLLENWMVDPIGCCEKAGVQATPSALQFTLQQRNENFLTESMAFEYHEEETLNTSVQAGLLKTETMCEICAMVIPASEETVPTTCEHRFCRSCWEKYLSVKIQDGDANITCPAFSCSRLVPIDVIENLVSSDLVRRYLQFDIKAFVDCNPNINWCPYPGCCRAVRLPESELIEAEIINIKSGSPLPSPHAVDCGHGHYFCWECLGVAHSPCCCERWKEWHQKIAEVKPEELKSTYIETEDAANCLWLITNSKPCPNCKSPIQKNEGCNHMKCSKCKFDFCWVCLEAWNKHNSATGGYFRCNRYEAVHRAEEKRGALYGAAEQRNKEVQELNRFVHYYTRFRNHENSHKMEEPLMKVAKDKMLILATSIPDLPSSSAEVETKFIEDAVAELLKARRVLCGSYVYGYYLEDNGYNKTVFELMQNELEECTEKLAQMVARPYLRTPRAKIIQATTLVKRRRQEFLAAASKGLVPPETPSTICKLKKQFPGHMMMDSFEAEQLSQAIAASLRDLDPNDPWVKDSFGRHTNFTAIYDWPDYDSDEDDDVNQALAASLIGVCARNNCGRLRARNPRTGALHDYCSLRCSKLSATAELTESFQSYPNDDQIELLIALEMSRLQIFQDAERRQEQERMESLENNESSCSNLHQTSTELQDCDALCSSASLVKHVTENVDDPCIEELLETAKEMNDDENNDDENGEIKMRDDGSDNANMYISTASPTLPAAYFFKESDKTYLNNIMDETKFISKSDKQLLYKSSSTSSLDHPRTHSDRLTASTGNIATSLVADEWGSEEIHRLLRQQSDASSNSLALTHDSADISELASRLVVSTGNLSTPSCSSKLRRVCSVLDMPKQSLNDTSSNSFFSRNPWACIFSHIFNLPRSYNWSKKSSMQMENFFV